MSRSPFARAFSTLASTSRRTLLATIAICLSAQPSFPTDVHGRCPHPARCGQLDRLIDTDSFDLYFTDDSSCPQAITASEAIAAWDFLECARQLYLDPTWNPNPALRFADPSCSPWTLQHPKRRRDSGFSCGDAYPVWIDRPGPAAGVAGEDGWLRFPASSRLLNPTTTNPLHEFGHLASWATGGWLSYGPMKVMSEGLATFLEVTMREYDTRYSKSNCDAINPDEGFVDFSRHSLRTHEYCDLSTFWRFLSRFTRLGEPEFYFTADLPVVCQNYLAAITDPPIGDTGHPQMRRIPGRDVILAVLRDFSNCFPDAWQTALCPADRGHNNGHAAFCDGEHRYSSTLGAVVDHACLPDRHMYGDDAGRRVAALGEIGIAIGLRRLDSALVPTFVPHEPRLGDGVGYAVYRRYLEWNYSKDDSTQTFRLDDNGFSIRSFEVHYHELDISDRAATVFLERGDDLPNWAVGVFYVGANQEITTISGGTGWADEPTQVVEIPQSPLFDRAVVMVAALDGVYNPDEHTDYGGTNGHYRLITDRDRPLVMDHDRDGRNDELLLYSQHTRSLFLSLDANAVPQRTVEPQKGQKALIQAAEIPLIGDFDTDTYVDDLALFHPVKQSWRLYRDAHDSSPALIRTLKNPGRAGDLPIVLDVDCSGSFEIGVFRPSERSWAIDLDLDGLDEVHVLDWGEPGDLPFTGDFDGDSCHDDLGLYRPSVHRWFYNHNEHDPSRYFDSSTDEGIHPRRSWALAGDLPFAGDLEVGGGDGTSGDVGVLRTTSGEWFGDIGHDGDTNWSLPAAP